jgi:hypothetical protein
LNAENNNTQALLPLSTPDTQTQQANALRSFRTEYEEFFRRSAAAWDAEKDSSPHTTDDGKYLLGRVADRLLEFRGRIAKDSGQLTAILAEATKRIKSLQRHQAFLDGGRSFREFWQQGNDVLLLLEIVPGLLEDAIDDGKAGDRESLIRAVVEELKFNRQHLSSLEYSTALILRTEQLDSLLASNIRLPQRLLTNIRSYSQNVKAAREVHKTTAAGGDSTLELIKIEQLLQSARNSGDAAIHELATFCHYRYNDQPTKVQAE